MKEKTTKATGYHYKPMPTLYHDEQAERRARHHIEELTAAINEYVEKFRSNGVTIDTEDELRLLTPEVVREQIQATRQRRLGERFLPASIRQAEEREFNRMERTLAPLAEELQETLKNIPFPIHVGGKDNTYLSGDEVEEYIEKASTVEIPRTIRDYYEQLQKVCLAWFDLCTWCSDNNFAPPSQKVLQSLTESRASPLIPSHLQSCMLSLTPEQMFTMWQYQTITTLS